MFCSSTAKSSCERVSQLPGPLKSSPPQSLLTRCHPIIRTHDVQQLGHWLQQHRRALNLTQLELAERSGCTLSMLQKIEQGRRWPSPALLERLASELGLAAQDILDAVAAHAATAGRPRQKHVRPNSILPHAILETAEETGGEYVRLELTAGPGGYAAARHVHPHQAESFEIVRGQFTLQVDGEEHQLGPGEQATVPPNTPHVWRNSSDQESVMLLEFRPALKTEEFF